MRMLVGLIVSVLSVTIVWPARGEDTLAGDKANAIVAVRKILQHASEAAAAVQEKSDSGVQSAKDWVLREIALAQAKAGDSRGAVRSAAAIQDHPLRDSTLAAAAGRPANRMDKGTPGNPHARSVRAPAAILEDYNRKLATRAMVVALADAGEPTEALRVAASIGDDSWRANAVAAVAESLVRAGDSLGALRIVPDIPTAMERARVLARIALVQVRAGDQRAAAILLQEALKTAAVIPADHAKAHALRVVAGALAEAGYVRAALLVARDQSSPSVKSQALLGAAQGILRLLDPDEARDRRDERLPANPVGREVDRGGPDYQALWRQGPVQPR